jgi:hypothetical protein
VLAYLEMSELLDALARIHRVARRGAIFYEVPLERIRELYERRDIGAIDPLRKQELSKETWDKIFTHAGFVPQGSWYRRV